MLKQIKLHRALKDIGATNREAEVAECITRGLSNRETASQLFIADSTLKIHLDKLYLKLKLTDVLFPRRALIIWCLPFWDN